MDTPTLVENDVFSRTRPSHKRGPGAEAKIQGGGGGGGGLTKFT